MEKSNAARRDDTQDALTQAGDAGRPVSSDRPKPGESRAETPPQDPVPAPDPRASSSRYSPKDSEEERAPMDDDMERLVDPSIGRERVSNNPDVMDLEDAWIVESEEPDFTVSPGTVDIQESVADAEPYFPLTDPPLAALTPTSSDETEDFAEDSEEESTDTEDSPLGVLGGDEEVRLRVIRALRTDAYTADMNIHVEVEDGVVYLTGKVRSLEDIEQAEQVAGSVEGVEEVEEELEIV